MTKLQMKIKVIFYNANSPIGCIAGIESLQRLERTVTTIEESDFIKERINDLFQQGNRMVVGARL